MKKLSLTFLILLFTLTSNVVWSADFNKGLEAAQRGDFLTALREWEPLAEQGDSFAQYNLGNMYLNGDAFSEDWDTAIETAEKWFRLAAEQGHTDAKRQLNQINNFYSTELLVETEKYENGQVKSERFYENGQIVLEEHYKDDKLDGKVTGWYHNGQIRFEQHYKDGTLDGKWTEWYYGNGHKKQEGNYKDGKIDGKRTIWHQKEGIFKDDKCISGNCDFFDNWEESDYK